MRFVTWVGALLVCSFASCADGGAGSSGAPRTASPSSAVCLPVAPMQLLALEHGAEWEPIATLAADGSVSTSRKHDAIAFLIAADEVRDAKGVAKFTCDTTRTLHVVSSPLSMHFDASDALVGDGNDTSRIFVADSGDVEVTLGGPSRTMPWKVTGASRATRRTAELVVLVAMTSAWGR